MRTIKITDEEYEMICSLFREMTADEIIRLERKLTDSRIGTISTDSAFVYKLVASLSRYVMIDPAVHHIPIDHKDYKYIKTIVNFFFRNFKNEIFNAVLENARAATLTIVDEAEKAKRGFDELKRYLERTLDDERGDK